MKYTGIIIGIMLVGLGVMLFGLAMTLDNQTVRVAAGLTGVFSVGVGFVVFLLAISPKPSVTVKSYVFNIDKAIDSTVVEMDNTPVKDRSKMTMLQAELQMLERFKELKDVRFYDFGESA